MDRAGILLIEDNRLVRWWIGAILIREGFRVVAPPTVEEGLRLGVSYPFDVLITDWQLPDGHDGFQVLAAVRRAFPRTDAILISAEADEELARRALQAGFGRVLKKPMDSSDLIGAVRAFRPMSSAVPSLSIT